MEHELPQSEIYDHREPEPTGMSLVESIKSEGLTDALASVSDVGIDLLSGSGIPVLSTMLGVYKAQRQVRQSLEYRSVVRFLSALKDTSAEDRRAFTNRLQAKGKVEEFGENILLLLTRTDDVKKPELIGRVMAAHIQGHFDFEKAMRLVSIVARCYAQDLSYLRDFKSGVQRAGTDIAASLFSAGLLANAGFDGGDFSDPESGGVRYDLNEYGRLLREYAL